MRGWRKGGGGGSLSAFVNMCLHLGHLHKAMRASICCVARQIQSQSFAHLPRSLTRTEGKPAECCARPYLTVTLSVGEQEHALPHFSQ